MHRTLFHVLVAVTLVVQLGAVRPCLLDETLASWFGQATTPERAADDAGNARPPGEDVNSPVLEHRPGVHPGTKDDAAVGRMHALAAAVPFGAPVEPAWAADRTTAGASEAASNAPPLPPWRVALTLPLLI